MKRPDPKAPLRKALRAMQRRQGRGNDPARDPLTKSPLLHAVPADWYRAGQDGSRDLQDWIRARGAEWEMRQAAAPPAPETVDTRHDVELNERLIDWDALAVRKTSTGTVSVIIPTYRDWKLTTTAVQCVAEAASESDFAVEIIVLSNGCGRQTAIVLDSLPLRFANVRVVHRPVNHGFALGNNLALEHTTGSVVVFLNNDTEARRGWLEPLVAALDEPDVVGAQSLLLYPSGEIQSAGIAFPSCGGIPHPLLQGHPVEEAADLAAASFSALTAAALAMRFSDVVALRGFDPLFRNGMEDVDLGLRARRLRSGRFTVRPDSIVVHHESKTPGRFTHAMANRRVLLDRWGIEFPGDDLELWWHAGHEVVGYTQPRYPAPDPLLDAPQPVLMRAPKLAVTQGAPPLRWVLKNPAPPGLAGETSNETHSARQLARALRGLGQQVTIDYRPAFDRAHDPSKEVVLALRGRDPYTPAPGPVSLLWVVSHPGDVTAQEVALYDQVFAAGARWAKRSAEQWGVRIDPLLHATDPLLFHPDRGAPDTGEPILVVGPARDDEATFPHHELGAAYRSAGIVRCDHGDQMRADGFLSRRLFDAAAAGARVLTDDVSGLGDLFGRSVQVARSPEDLARLTRPEDFDAIYGDDGERRRVAARVAADHSFEARARVLLQAALDARAKRRT